MKYYMGIDNGGTTTKAAIYDENGKEIAVYSVDTDVIVLSIDFAERDMEQMWKANCYVIKNVIEKSNINPTDIKCIACSGHGKGLYIWGKNNKAARNGIISTDNRAWEYPIKWKENGIAEKVFDISYQSILACQPVSLLSWIRDNEPETLKNIKWVFECKDYIRFRLTGEAYAEITDYSGSNLLNLKTKNYDIELLKLFNLEDIMNYLPPIKDSTDICGYITKEVSKKTLLPEGTPVAGGMFDINACAIATGVINEKHICMIAGTWSINEYIRKTPVLDKTVLMNSVFCMQGYHLIEECSPTSAGNFEWFLKNILTEYAENMKDNKKEMYKQLDENVKSIAAKEFCPIFLPFLMASNVHPNAKSCFVGMNNYHTRAHIIKGLYEGVAFSHKYHLEKLLANYKGDLESIRLAGGVANSNVWIQIFADIMNIPIEIVDVGETGAFGSAIAASVACGDYTDLEYAVSKMVKIKNKIMPIKDNTTIYEKKFELYNKVINSLDNLWNYIQHMVEGKY